MSIYDDDLSNARKLVAYLEDMKHPKYQAAWSLLRRLEANVENYHIHGSPPQVETNHSQIIGELNIITDDVFHVSLDKIHAAKPPEPDKTPDPPNPSTRSATFTQPRSIPVPLPSSSLGLPFIFISHTKLDKPFVEKLKKDLEAAGSRVWYDKDSIHVGQSIPEEINKALSQCDYFLVVLTPESVDAPWVKKELAAAEMGNKKIMTVLLKECPIPPLLQAYRYADFHTNHEEGLQQLLDGLGLPLPNSLLSIFRIIEQMIYDGDLTSDQGQILKALFMSVAMKKQKGEEPMSPTNPNNSSEMFSYASQILMYDLLSLADYHNEWPHLVVSDNFKKDSIKLLKKMQQQILVSSALIQQINKLDYTDEIEQILEPLKSLQSILINIDDHLFSGNMPFSVKNEIERNFDDLTYRLNKYLLMLNELGSSPTSQRRIQ